MLDRRLRSLVNTLAHAEGQTYAEALKRRLLAELDALRATGATYAELLAHINNWTPKGDDTP